MEYGYIPTPEADKEAVKARSPKIQIPFTCELDLSTRNN